MNKRFEVCQKDVYHLEQLSKTGRADSANQPGSYRDLVVLKPWGYEFLAFENEDVAIWFLHIKEGHSTSMHCHPLKSTTLVVLNGEAFFHTFMTRNNLKSNDAAVIDKGVFHSTASVSPQGLYLLELETPPNKTDLVRFNDKYGRVLEGYEPASQMASTELERFDYFHFTEAADDNQFAASGFKVSLHEWKSNDEEPPKLGEHEKALICRGQVCAGEDQKLGLGDVFDRHTFLKKKIWIPEPVTLFIIDGVRP